jgi:hypothetical protein
LGTRGLEASTKLGREHPLLPNSHFLSQNGEKEDVVSKQLSQASCPRKMGTYNFLGELGFLEELP